MKKLLITIPFLFLAAACNKQIALVQPAQNQQVQTAGSAQQQAQAISTEETANWQFYNKYGVQFKYPSDWMVEDSAVNCNDKCPVNLSLRNKKYQNSLESAGMSIYDIDWAGNFKNSKNGKTFFATDAQNEVVRLTFTENGKTFYSSCALYGDAGIINICNQIISTFKFTK